MAANLVYAIMTGITALYISGRVAVEVWVDDWTVNVIIRWRRRR